MKKLIAFIQFLFMALVMNAQSEFVINGEVGNANDGLTLILSRSGRDTLDITRIENGKFTLKSTTDTESEAFPQLQAIDKKYKDKLVVISINLDGDYDLWKKASGEHGITWENLSQNSTIRSETGINATYQIKAIPQYMILSPEGVVLNMWAGFFKDPKVMESIVCRYVK